MRLRISIIGAGRVGQTLGRLAKESGYDIGDIVCRSVKSARKAVRFIGSGSARQASLSHLTAADLILISTPDDSINEAVEMIEDSARAIGRAVVLHTSGALSSDVLRPLARFCMSRGSCHPLQSFQDPARALQLIRGSYFCIEGEARAVKAARRLARRMGARPFEIATEMKSLYHAAAVLASGGMVSLFSVSQDMLGSCGLSEQEARRVLLPLAEGTLANLRAVGPARALTGPVRRGDTGTVRRNLKAVASVDSDWLGIYKLLARRSLILAERAGTDKQSLELLARLLKK